MLSLISSEVVWHTGGHAHIVCLHEAVGFHKLVHITAMMMICPGREYSSLNDWKNAVFSDLYVSVFQIPFDRMMPVWVQRPGRPLNSKPCA